MEQWSATAAELKRMLGDLCEFCAHGLKGHRFALFASAICNRHGIPESSHFTTLVQHRRLVELHEFKEFQGSRDGWIVYAIGCPHSLRPMYDMVVVFDPFELYARDRLIDRFMTVEDDADAVRTLVQNDEWHMFN